MKRSDIKTGTIGIICFAVVAFILMVLFSKNNGLFTGSEEKEEAISTLWSDTLTNAASDLADLAPMDREIENFMHRFNIRGASLAVVRHDSLIFAKGYGYADAEAGKPMEPTSIMRMASVSKLVTAVAIMKLREQGKLRLDSKVFGPDGILNDTAYTNAIRDKRILDITVDNLLQHKGGFTLGAGDPMFNTKDIMLAKHLTTPPDNHQLTKIVLGRKLGFEPGNGRRYSNFGYMLLSLIIEKLSGKSYWDYVDENVLKPSAIHNMRPATNYYKDRHDKEVRYYAPDDEMVEEYNGSGKMVPRVYGGSNVNGLLGAGGWVGSAADIARLVASIDKNPVVGDVLTPGSVDFLTEYRAKDKLSRGWSDADSLGKWVRTGTLSSSHALVERFPNGDCWVLFTNTGVWTGHHFSSDMHRLVEKLRAQYTDKMPRRTLW